MKKLYPLILSGLMIVVSVSSYALNAEEIYKKANRSVFTVYTVNFYDKSPESLGSAVAVTDHILATNCHVALTGNYLGIIVNKEFKLGTLFFRDVSRDICFVEVPGVKFYPVKIRNSEDVKVGEPVYAIGNPEGLEKSISQGIISNKKKNRGGYVLQTDATVSFGSSGGGLFDQNGDLIGITNSVDRHSKNIAFAIPTEWITQILFPKVLAETQDQGSKKERVAHAEKKEKKPIRKLGQYGKANIELYSYNQKCFFLFTGKNKYGEGVSSAIWYPEKPSILLIFPDSIDIHKNFRIMNDAFYSDQEQAPIYSNNFLYFGDKKLELVGIKDENGRFPLLVTKIPTDSKDQLSQLPNFKVNYEDGVTVQGFSNVSYELDGLKGALSAYDKQCPLQKTNEKEVKKEGNKNDQEDQGASEDKEVSTFKKEK